MVFRHALIRRKRLSNNNNCNKISLTVEGYSFTIKHPFTNAAEKMRKNGGKEGLILRSSGDVRIRSKNGMDKGVDNSGRWQSEPPH